MLLTNRITEFIKLYLKIFKLLNKIQVFFFFFFLNFNKKKKKKIE